MGFLNLWALAVGGLALAAPLAVHLLTRPRPVAYHLSTMKLLAEVIQQRRARSRIRDWIILLLRALAVALLALALARPTFKGNAVVPVTADTGAARVIVLDVSQSMAAGSGGASSLVQARAAALEFLDAMPGAHANVILAAAQPQPVFDQLSPNLPSLRQAVTEAGVRPERADVRKAMEMAGRMLGEGGEERQRELIVISDFQRSNWGRLFLESIPQETQVQLHAVRPAVLDNVALTSVHFENQPVAGQATMVHAELANYSDTPADVRCHLEIGSLRRTSVVTLDPQSTRTISEMVTLDAPGWVHGKARLESNLDVLPQDDQRPVVTLVRDAPQVALVTRQPETDRLGSSFYLQRALEVALATPGGSDSSVTRVHPQQTSPASWPEADLYVIDHPGQLNQAAIRHIAARVRRGCGLLYVASELVDAMNGDRLGQQLGAGFEPPVQLVAADQGAIRKDLFVTRLKQRQTPFRILGSEAESSFRPVRFAGGLPTRTVAEGLADQVLAELSDSSALLYLTGVDAGQVAVLNADLGASNWPTQSSFVPVLAELVKSLLSGSGGTTAACGEPLVRLLPAQLNSEAVLTAAPLTDQTPPATDYGKWEWSSSQGALVWTWAEPTGPGIYALRQSGNVAMAVATAPPAVESDLQMLDSSLLTEQTAGGRQVGYSDPAADESDRDDLWNWLIAACLLGLIAEITALRLFRV